MHAQLEEKQKKKAEEDAAKGSSMQRAVSIKDCFEHHTKYEDSHEQQKKFDQTTMRFIIKDLQPSSVVQGEGFKELIAVAGPTVMVKHHMTFSRVKLPHSLKSLRRGCKQCCR